MTSSFHIPGVNTVLNALGTSNARKEPNNGKVPEPINNSKLPEVAGSTKVPELNNAKVSDSGGGSGSRAPMRRSFDSLRAGQNSVRAQLNKQITKMRALSADSFFDKRTQPERKGTGKKEPGAEWSDREPKPLGAESHAQQSPGTEASVRVQIEHSLSALNTMSAEAQEIGRNRTSSIPVAPPDEDILWIPKRGNGIEENKQPGAEAIKQPGAETGPLTDIQLLQNRADETAETLRKTLHMFGQGGESLSSLQKRADTLKNVGDLFAPATRPEASELSARQRADGSE